MENLDSPPGGAPAFSERDNHFNAVVAVLKEWAQALFDQWSLSSTLLVGIIFVLWIVQQVWTYDADLHPLQLGRQSSRTAMRMPKESAVYRPASMALNGLARGLNVVKEGAPKFSGGRDGDLRDVWRQFVRGEEGKTSKIKTVWGTERVETHDTDDLTRQISLIGDHLSQHGSSRIAIQLPNSVELLLALFACSFYPKLTAILIPHNASTAELTAMLRASSADTLIAAPGTFALESVAESYPGLRKVVWVVDSGTSSMDWTTPPPGASTINIATWADIVSAPAASPLSTDTEELPGDIVIFDGLERMTTFTQKHVVAGMAGQIAAIPSSEHFGPNDTFLPAELLTDQYTLILTLVALFSNANVALNSVAGREAPLSTATTGVSPTVLVVSPEQALVYHAEGMKIVNGSFMLRQAHAFRQRHLENFGVLFNTTGFLHKLETGAAPAIGKSPEVRPRIVYVAERAGQKPVLSQKMLSDLRALWGGRVVHALVVEGVAGPLAQSLWYDYRVRAGQPTHFGPPAGSVEVWLSDKGEYITTDFKIRGEINVKGPSVVGGKLNTGVLGAFNRDVTLSVL